MKQAYIIGCPESIGVVVGENLAWTCWRSPERSRRRGERVLDLVSAQSNQRGAKQVRCRDYTPVSDRRVKESNEEKYRKDEPSSTCEQRHAPYAISRTPRR